MHTADFITTQQMPTVRIAVVVTTVVRVNQCCCGDDGLTTEWKVTPHSLFNVAITESPYVL